MMNESWIAADWPLSGIISAGTTTRIGGLSEKPWQSLNLGLHVGDDVEPVIQNRQLIKRTLNLPGDPLWLNQTHGISVCDSTPTVDSSYDAAWTDSADRVLVVLTADCLPVVIANRNGVELGVAHAGWKGLANGVVSQLVQRFSGDRNELQVWLGPAIGPQSFEVGDEVRDLYLAQWATLDKRAIESAFIRGKPGKWYADLYALARLTLRDLGVQQVYGGQHCTFKDRRRFFSYRRDGKKSGRMATLVWRSNR